MQLRLLIEGQAVKLGGLILSKDKEIDLLKSKLEAVRSETYDEAQDRLQVFVSKWKSIEPKAVHAFTWGIKRTFT